MEEPIRYRPHQANLVTIRAKNNGLTLFNGKNQLIMKNYIKFAASNGSTCKCTQDDDSQTTKTIVKLPKNQRAGGQEYK